MRDYRYKQIRPVPWGKYLVGILVWAFACVFLLALLWLGG